MLYNQPIRETRYCINLGQGLLTPRAARETAALTGRLDLDYQIGVEDSSTQMKRVHETISAFTLETIVYLRSKQLGLLQGFCSAKSEFKYWQKEGRKAYANPERMNENYKSFCDGIKALDNTINWSKSQTFLEGTPNEQTFHLRLSNDAREYVKEDCLFSFNRIINGRDGNDANNPMNWKFGGRWVREDIPMGSMSSEKTDHGHRSKNRTEAVRGGTKPCTPTINFMVPAGLHTTLGGRLSCLA